MHIHNVLYASYTMASIISFTLRVFATRFVSYASPVRLISAFSFLSLLIRKHPWSFQCLIVRKECSTIWFCSFTNSGFFSALSCIISRIHDAFPFQVGGSSVHGSNSHRCCARAYTLDHMGDPPVNTGCDR